MLQGRKYRMACCMAAGVVMVCMMVLLGSGCSSSEKKEPSTQPVSRYQSMGLRAVPEYLKGTILERANLEDTRAFVVSGYGLVVNLRETGDNGSIPTLVREYMVKEMLKHGMGMHRVPGYENMDPEKVLRDKRVAVVRVDGFIPPGARQDDHFDVLVSVPEESYTSSLARGDLFETELRYLGADPRRPGGSVNVYARAGGPIFVNPAYALNPLSTTAPSQMRSSLRYGVVMDGGVMTLDNPLVLRVRQPQFSLARAIERRIDLRFQDVADKRKQDGTTGVAAAQDEAIVHVFVPSVYRGDWEHFAGVVQHLYMNSDPIFSAKKAEQLAAAAVKPDAPLKNISYAWEGLGVAALPAVLPLMTHKSPEVAFAAAQAAAFIGDASGSAQMVLMGMAKTAGHPFQVNAVQVLGKLPQSPMINQMLRQLLNTDQTLVRLEAYRILSRNKDPLIYTKVIQEKFALDLVPSSGPPMVYASRRGIPRIAIFGSRAALDMPIIFTTMDSKLSIASTGTGNGVTMFYRGDSSTWANKDDRGPVKQVSRADLADVVARLGGEGTPGEKRFDFSYGDIVAIVQALNDAKKLTAVTNGQRVPALFVLQELPNVQDRLYNAPKIPDQGRPQGDTAPVGEVIPDTKPTLSNQGSNNVAGVKAAN